MKNLPEWEDMAVVHMAAAVAAIHLVLFVGLLGSIF